MKVLYVDISLSGHRYKYLNSLVEANKENVILVPKNNLHLKYKQYFMTSGYDKKRNYINYIKWIKEIKKLAEIENVDVVHILCGDALYRFFGLHLNCIKKKVIVTFHSVVFTKIRIKSFKKIFHKIFFGIVHTEYIKENLNKNKIYNVQKIEYPVFSQPINISKEEARKILEIPQDRICIPIMGKADYYKGTDLLLEALKYVDFPFFLYVTRAEGKYNEEYIKQHTHEYSEYVLCKTGMLSEEDYSNVIASADLIVLPYRKCFGGTSGPMLEAAWNRKFVIGPNHGSMGNLIEKYHLGATFESENVEALVQTLNLSVQKGLKLDNKSLEFKKKLDIEQFVDENLKIYNK